jgi:hypothetical protein
MIVTISNTVTIHRYKHVLRSRTTHLRTEGKCRYRLLDSFWTRTVTTMLEEKKTVRRPRSDGWALPMAHLRLQQPRATAAAIGRVIALGLLFGRLRLQALHLPPHAHGNWHRMLIVLPSSCSNRVGTIIAQGLRSCFVSLAALATS